MAAQYRLLRVLEYTGTREWLDDCIRLRGVKGSSPANWMRGQGIIREAILGDVAELLPPLPEPVVVTQENAVVDDKFK